MAGVEGCSPPRARDFRLQGLGQSASTIGDALVLVAVGRYVTRLTGDSSDVGLVPGAYSLPLVAFVLLGGVLADRLGQQEVTVVGGVLGSLVMALALLPRSTRELQRWGGAPDVLPAPPVLTAP